MSSLLRITSRHAPYCWLATSLLWYCVLMSALSSASMSRTPPLTADWPTSLFWYCVLMSALSSASWIDTPPYCWLATSFFLVLCTDERSLLRITSRHAPYLLIGYQFVLVLCTDERSLLRITSRHAPLLLIGYQFCFGTVHWWALSSSSSWVDTPLTADWLPVCFGTVYWWALSSSHHE